MLVGVAATAGSLAISLETAGSHALGPEQKRAALESSLSAASWLTILSVGLSAVLEVVGVAALGVALQSRLAASRATRARRNPNGL